MAQRPTGDWDIDPNTTSGTDLANILNRFQDAIDSGNSGGSRPSYLAAGGLWVQEGNPMKLFFWDGSTDTEIFNTADGIIGGMDEPTDDGDQYARQGDTAGNYSWTKVEHPEPISGGATDGTQDGIVATWDSTANSGAGQWTPDSSLTIDPTGDATFSGAVLANKAGSAVENYGDIIKAGTSSRGLWLGASNRSTSRAHTVGTISAPDANASAGISFRVGGDADAYEKMFLDAAGDASFSGAVHTSTIANKGSGAGIRFGNVNGRKTLRPYDALSDSVSSDIDIGNANTTWGTVFAESFQVWDNSGSSNKKIDLQTNGDATFSGVVSTGWLISGPADDNYVVGAGGGGGDFNRIQIMKPNDPMCLRVNATNTGVGADAFVVDQQGNCAAKGSITGTRMVQDGSPVIDAKGLIKTLSTLRQATKDETTLEGLRDSIGNAIGGLIEEFENQIAAMPAPEDLGPLDEEPEAGTMDD